MWRFDCTSGIFCISVSLQGAAREAWWPHGWCAHLRIEWSGFEPWPGSIVLCSSARHLTLTVPLSTQVYKWAPVNLMLGVKLASHPILSRGE